MPLAEPKPERGDGEESKPSHASTSGAGGVSAAEDATSKPSDTADELWWRYESPSHEAVDAVGDGTGSGSGGVGEAQEGDGVRESSDSGKGCSSKDRRRVEVAVRVNCPIRVLDPKDGVYECHAEGKEAQTVGCIAWRMFIGLGGRSVGSSNAVFVVVSALARRC